MEPTIAQHLSHNKNLKNINNKIIQCFNNVSISYSCQNVQRIRKFEQKCCEPRNTPKFSFGCKIFETTLLDSPKNITDNHKISLHFLCFKKRNELSNLQDIYHDFGSAPSFGWWRPYNLKSLSSNSRAKGKAKGYKKVSVIHSILDSQITPLFSLLLVH